MPAIEPHDPAPSRLKYRLERMWMTPVYRSLIRTGLPVTVVVLLVGNYLQKPEVQTRLASSVTQARAMIESRPEFALKLMRIQGASPVVAEQIREAVPLVFPLSSLRVDLNVLKERIEQVDAVKTAALFMRTGILDVQIDERIPKLVWRVNGNLQLVDDEGIRAGMIANRAVRTDLPLIVGEGAADYAAEALKLINALGPLVARFRGLQRIGERRWDVVLDRQQKIQLPTDNPVAALERVIALQNARDLLERDVLVVDVRDGHRPIIRLTASAMTELRRLRQIADEEDKKL